MEKVIKITPPFDNDMLLRKQKSIKRQLLTQDSGLDKTRQIKRIAILGGSTTADIKNLLEIFLLDAGIKPVFYESEYNKFYEDAVFGNEELSAFNPEIIIIFTSVVNLISKPFLTDTTEQIEEKIDNEYHRYQNVWNSLSSRFPSSVIMLFVNVSSRKNDLMQLRAVKRSRRKAINVLFNLWTSSVTLIWSWSNFCNW